MQIKVNNRELREGYCTREIKKIIAIAKEAFNRKISPDKQAKH